jgi:integrase
MLMQNPTKTLTTIATYERLGRRLTRRADELERLDEMGEVQDFDRRVAIAYLDLEPTISKATARLYRAAAIYCVQKDPGDFECEAMHMLAPEPSERDDFHEEWLTEQRAKNLTALRGAQQKAKWLPEQDWQALFIALGKSDSKWAMPAIQWLAATLVTGLRPIEWRNAVLTGKCLTVQNAKATNGRAHGETRTLDLSRSAAVERSAVGAFVETVKQHAESGFPDLYNGVRSLLRRIARRVFEGRKKFPSLYTARHVFAARAKATFGRDWVAALMGHASTSTAARHYARAHHARGGRPLGVEPSQDNVDAVRRSAATLRGPGGPDHSLAR